jgi:hypothetical protein
MLLGIGGDLVFDDAGVDVAPARLDLLGADLPEQALKTGALGRAVNASNELVFAEVDGENKARLRDRSFHRASSLG